MKKIIFVFLDSLLVNPKSLSGVNQTRIVELNDYLDFGDEVSIFAMSELRKYKQLHSRLKKIIRLLSKNVSRTVIIINSFNNLSNFVGLDGPLLTGPINYLKNKVEAEKVVIFVGELLKEWYPTRKLFNFTLVNWPYGSTKTLAQLCFEQTQLDIERNAASENITRNFLQPKQIEKRDAISCDCQSLQAQMLQLEESQLRLITSIGKFEKEMIQSEQTQIHLLEDSAKNFPLHVVETAATLALLAWHFVPYVYEKICKIINYCCNDKSKNGESKRVKPKRVKPKKAKPKAVANASAVKPKVVRHGRQIVDSFSYSSINVEGLVENNDKNIGLKNFSKNNHNVGCLGMSGSFFTKKDNSDIHMSLLSSDKYSKPSKTSYCELELA